MNYRSDFKYDLEVGQVYEKLLGDIFENKKVEVKRDFGATKTGNVFVEYECRGKKSGIETTMADWWCFFIKDNTSILVETKELKVRCRKYINTRRDVKGGDNNLSKGILLPLKDLI